MIKMTAKEDQREVKYERIRGIKIAESLSKRRK
ncbi:hypothetical protein BH18THE2_BH18THE2_16930 [soil metagenome]